MPLRITNRFLGILLFLFVAGFARGQAGLCPPNLDFEFGDFRNWLCRTGTVATPGGVNTITWAGVGQTANRHTIIPAAGAGVDAYGLFPETCPNGSNFSVKLGNETATTNGGVGWEASGITYTYTIPAGIPVFSVFFQYAVVLQNPGHLPEAQPRFRARIRDLTTGLTLPCVTFDFIAGGALGGFQPSPVNPAVLYKDWTPVTLNLTGLAGRTIELEFIVTECTQGGHFAYAYVDVNSNCNGAISGTTICQGDNAITLTAPFGFQSYEWYSDNTFTTLLGTNQTLPMNPAPAVGTIIPLIVYPFPGFGCKDTLYATITVSPKPVSVAGPDLLVCSDQSIQIGGPPTLGYTYAWTPAGQVNSTNVSDPMAWLVPPGPNEFIVKTTDILTGCYSEDTMYLSGIVVDTAIRLTGNADFCDGENEALLSVNSSSTSIQWYDGNTPIPGATSATYQPTVSGNYWAQLVQNGCTDSTATIPINVHAIPLVSFFPDTDTSCVTKNTFLFTNTSSAPDNATMTYNWLFSDGTTSQALHATKSFTATGIFNIKLITTTAFGCKDSASTDVYVLPNGKADFTWDSICVNRPVQFVNRSIENGSVKTDYTWDFQNGGPGYMIKNPPPVIYTTPGTVDVTLQLVNLGCENDPQIVTKKIQANPLHTPVRYRDITVPQNASQFIHVRDTVGKNYSWRPRIQLSNYNAQYTEFFATGNDVLYYIDITDPHTCVTTDTILMQVLKKPGYYLPTAFTPNGDGLNDVVRPYLVGMKSLKSFSVFNRWGQLVFFSTKEGETWNGKNNGEDLDTGVYVWMLEFYNNDGKLITEKGTITLIR
ncbi:MAG: gliding motility-associated C-terminal domain-containing protein [Bacteroidetes bacterium]|nr:gliding motility-associated C-terminal domain-containing protein [Bacteroidota bacterium]